MLFFSFILSHWLHHYLYNYFATTYTSAQRTRGESNENRNKWLKIKERKNKHAKQLYMVKQEKPLDSSLCKYELPGD